MNEHRTTPNSTDARLACTKMEVDPPTTFVAPCNSGTMKRSNSAPMINLLTSSPIDTSPPSSFHSSEITRTRRLSFSQATLHSPNTPLKTTDRVNQIKHEEIRIPDREAAYEREVQTTMQMTNSLDEFSIEEPMVTEHRRPRSFSESLHIVTTPNVLLGSPSPTRLSRQCFSPSMQIPVKNITFTPSPSPSPTRKSYMRSMSPIAIRPSPLGKRKFDLEADTYLSPAKRANSTGGNVSERNTAHPLAHSVSSSSVESESSPEQTVPRGATASAMGGGLIQARPSLYEFAPVYDGSTPMHQAGIIPDAMPTVSMADDMVRDEFLPLDHDEARQSIVD